MDDMKNSYVEEVNTDNMPQNDKHKSSFSAAVKGMALIIGLFMVGNIIGSLTNIKKIDNFHTENNLTETSTTAGTSSQTTYTTETTSSTQTTQITTTEKETTNENTTKETTTEPHTTEDNTPDEKDEIIALFNTSANKIKKTAKKVIRNYDDKRYDEELSDYPRVLNLVGGSLIDSWLVRHDTPVEYDEPELIRENYPVKGKDWVSRLESSDVAEATCVEKDGKYEIVLTLLYCKDPEENSGVCVAMQEVNLEVVQELVPIVKSCSVEYYDCVIRCTIEKDSGNMIYSKYTQPMVLDMTAGRINDMKAIFAMTFESEYVIEY